MILFGLGNAPKIILIVIIILFQIIIAARDGVREIPAGLFHSVGSLGLNRLDLYRHLILPAVLPKIITAIRISIGVSISVLFFGESFATQFGIGYFIMNSWMMVNYVEMFSGILVLGLAGLALFKLVDLIEGRLCRWIRIGKDQG
jgi:NitT/TauT family transport system permease protein